MRYILYNYTFLYHINMSKAIVVKYPTYILNIQNYLCVYETFLTQI